MLTDIDVMHIEPFYEPGTGSWTYLLADTASRVAAIIDPVMVYNPVSGMTDPAFIDAVRNFAREADYRIDWVLETHAHADHLTAADYLRRRNGAKIACSRGICGVQDNFVRVFNLGDEPTDGSQFDRLLDDGDSLYLGALELRVMATPGHTNDSVSYLVADAAFIGDTLFAPRAGTARCDFPGGDAAELFDSVQRLHALPDDTRLFLCHDYPDDGVEPVCCITVAESRRANVHLTQSTPRQQFVTLRCRRDAQLDLPRLILPALQVNIRAGAPPPADRNGVSYLRTPFNRALSDLLGPGASAEKEN
ncbi:MAG: MBL fold metallo-hydrolase [Xanthomonadales bacterium]|nr:MBL fold metallo-hydrolase [Xanthomonadales bacterium]